MSLYLAITRGDVADYLSTLIFVYVILIFIRIIMSWVQLPYYPWLRAFMDWVSAVVDPYLAIWRRILPMVRIGPGALDLSPIVGVIVLTIVGGIVENLIRG
jgi:YggT family protein